MRIKSEIKEKIYSHYLKKGMLNAIKKLEDRHKANTVDIPKVLSDINKSIVSIKAEVDLFSKAIDVVELKYEKNNEAAEVSTIFSFLSLSMLDIFVLHKQYLSTNDSIEKNFICRTAAQHMYEFLEDGSKALGKQMNYLTDKLNDTQINLKLKALRKSFYELKAELHTPLKKLRNNVSGHKDRNIRNQLAMSNAIDIVDFQIFFISFMLFFLTLTQFKRLVVDEIIKQKSTDINTTTANS